MKTIGCWNADHFFSTFSLRFLLKMAKRAANDTKLLIEHISIPALLLLLIFSLPFHSNWPIIRNVRFAFHSSLIFLFVSRIISVEFVIFCASRIWSFGFDTTLTFFTFSSFIQFNEFSLVYFFAVFNLSFVPCDWWNYVDEGKRQSRSVIAFYHFHTCK